MRPPKPEFFFVGSAVLPVLLVVAGRVELAVLVFVFLVVAGGLCAIADPDAPHRERDRRWRRR